MTTKEFNRLIKHWKVGNVKVARIVELEGLFPPFAMFENLTEDRVKSIRHQLDLSYFGCGHSFADAFLQIHRCGGIRLSSPELGLNLGGDMAPV